MAGLPICVESADTAFFEQRFAEYRRNDQATPVMTLRTRIRDFVPKPDGEVIQRVRGVVTLRQSDGYLLHYPGDPAQGEASFVIRYLPDYSDAEIILTPARATSELSLTDWEYVYSGAVFRNRLAVLGGGVLHSSALSWRGKGVAFSADPGVGKSTHVNLWKECFGDDVVVINDDKPAIFYEGDQAMLCGTPWSGKTALNTNRQVPLHAIVFIERGEQNAIRRLDTVESIRRLLGQLARPYYDAELGLRAVDFAERLCDTLPICCLTCNISREAVKTAFCGLFGRTEWPLSE